MNTSTGQGGLEQRSFRNSGIRLSGNVVTGLKIPRVINGSSECRRRSARVIDPRLNAMRGPQGSASPKITAWSACRQNPEAPAVALRHYVAWLSTFSLAWPLCAAKLLAYRPPNRADWRAFHTPADP